MLTQHEFEEWQAFTNVRGPIGGPRQDLYARMISIFAAQPRKDPLHVTDYLEWLPKVEDDTDEPYVPDENDTMIDDNDGDW